GASSAISTFAISLTHGCMPNFVSCHGADPSFFLPSEPKQLSCRSKPGLRTHLSRPTRSAETKALTKRLISLILKQDEVDALETRRWILGEVTAERAHHRLSRLLWRHSPDPRPEGG